MAKKDAILTLQVIADKDNVEELKALHEITKVYLDYFQDKPYSHLTSMPLSDGNKDLLWA